MTRTVSTCALALVLAAAACGSDTGPASDIAQLRVMHVRAGAPAIDLVVEGATLVEDVPFARTSAFVDVPAGESAVEIRQANAPGVLGAHTFELVGGERYTLLYSNSGNTRDISLAPDTATGVPTQPPPTSAADTAAIPGESKVKLRVIHNASDAPPLDVYLTTADAPLEGALPLIEPFRYGTGLSPEFPGYVERDPGVYRVRFTADGTHDVVLDTGPLDMPAGFVRTVVLFSSDTTGLGVGVVRER
jgi:hypothetical protein